MQLIRYHVKIKCDDFNHDLDIIKLVKSNTCFKMCNIIVKIGKPIFPFSIYFIQYIW